MCFKLLQNHQNSFFGFANVCVDVNEVVGNPTTVHVKYGMFLCYGSDKSADG